MLRNLSLEDAPTRVIPIALDIKDDAMKVETYAQGGPGGEGVPRCSCEAAARRLPVPGRSSDASALRGASTSSELIAERSGVKYPKRRESALRFRVKRRDILGAGRRKKEFIQKRRLYP